MKITKFIIFILAFCSIKAMAGQDVFFEALYLQTDRSYYVAGERIHYKIYQQVYPADTISSDIAYLELKNPEGETLTKNAVFLKNKHAWGNIYIPDSLGTGHYFLKCYTLWQKNFGQKYMFSKILQIGNRFDKKGTIKSYDKPISIHYKDSFLTSNIPNEIHYSTHGRTFYDNTTVKVTTTQDSIIRTDTLQGKNAGSFTITPQNDQSYFIRAFHNENMIYEEKIPVSKSRQFKLSTNRGGDSTGIDITTNDKDLANGFELKIYNKKGLINTHPVKFNKGKSNISFANTKLPDGLIRAVLYNNQDRIVKENLLYIESKDDNLLAYVDHQEYGPRQRVNISLNINEELSEFKKANLSVSVYKENQLTRMNGKPNARRWFNGMGEVKQHDKEAGLRNQPEAYLTLVDPQDWCFNSKGLRAKRTYPVETSGKIVTGRVYDTYDNTLVEGAEVYLALHDSSSYIDYYTTNENGRYFFWLPRSYNGRDYTVQVVKSPADLEMNKITIEDRLSSPGNNGFDYKASTDQYNSLFGHVYKAFNIRKLFYKSNTANYLESRQVAYEKIPEIYGIPQQSVLMSEYVPLDNFEEISTELLNKIRFKSKDKGYSMQVYNEENGRYMEQPPLVLLNGIPTQDFAAIASLSSEDIKEIDVVSKHFVWGNKVMPGLLAIYLNDPDIYPYEGEEFIKRQTLNINNSEDDYHFPEYENDSTQNSRKPDFRNTLYWNPEVNLNSGSEKEITFYTSDISGEYTISIEGMIDGNVPVSKTLQIDVKSKQAQ